MTLTQLGSGTDGPTVQLGEQHTTAPEQHHSTRVEGVTNPRDSTRSTVDILIAARYDYAAVQLWYRTQI
eukprot:COSAG02_NODE_25122_length_668_cov_1.695958_2_plen_68_part_01